MAAKRTHKAGNWSGQIWGPLYNGSFELPVITPSSFQAWSGSDDWTVSGSVWLLSPPDGFSDPTPPDGVQAIVIRAAASVSQSITLAGGTYSVNVYAARRTATNWQSIDVKLNGTTKGTITPVSNSYAQFNVSLGTLSAGTYTLAFVGKNDGPNENDCFLDQVEFVGETVAVPTIGDTATINHAVTVDTDETVGTSPSDTTTVVLQINAALSVAATVSFEVRGNVQQTGAGANFNMAQGSTLTVNASNAGTPATKYQWDIGTSSLSGNTQARFNVNGVAGLHLSHCTILSNSGGGKDRKSVV